MRVFLVLITLIGFSFASCNKNQRAVKFLDGTWELRKFNGLSVDDTSDQLTLIFAFCYLRQDEKCSMVMRFADQTMIPCNYNVLNNGKKLEIKELLTGIFVGQWEIIELTKTTFKFRVISSEVQHEYEMHKIE